MSSIGDWFHSTVKQVTGKSPQEHADDINAGCLFLFIRTQSDFIVYNPLLRESTAVIPLVLMIFSELMV